MSSFYNILFAILGGVMPALLWLWFWLREDHLHPEPKSKLVVVFLTGMISVFLVLPVEKFIFDIFLSGIAIITVICWAVTEEIFKLGVAYFTALKDKEMDEPIDAVIYMITAALGFSALENTLFIFNLINDGNFIQSILTSNSRFLGATLLHVASSAATGVMIGLAYYKKPIIKKIFLLTGFLISVILHTIFNLLIIKSSNNIFLIFSGVWVLVIILIVLIEKVKKIKS